jgi:TolB-like protein/Tfp pilus assembly protein PilF
MFTDIVGYTALMGKDEDAAFKLLRKNRDIHRAIINKFNGELLKEIGDGTLASFPNSSDAVRCAGEIQNTANKEDILLRIGIHEGEVVFEGGDVLGDGVNVASRLEELADKGCINISSAIYKDIRNKSGITAELIGEKTLKNVDEPVKVYKVTCKEISPDSSKEITIDSRLPEKKSIIVLPFDNMSPDPDQEFFSDGLTEEIITDLSHIKDLMVISRNSSMTFKGTKRTTKEIAEKVNVRYVLEGSVRKAGNNLRITAQLIDGLSDVHLWAEKYSGTLDDVFDIQEKVSRSIAGALKIRLSSSEQFSLSRKKIDDSKAYEHYLLARYEIWKFNEESLTHAIHLLNNSLNKIGKNEFLLVALATAYFQYVNAGIDPDEKHLDKALELIDEVLTINPYSPKAYNIKSWVHEHKGEIKESFISLKRAIELDPHDSDALIMMAFLYILIGKTDEARSPAKHAIDIDPLHPLAYTGEWFVNFSEGRFDKVLETCFKMYSLDKDNLLSAWAYGQALVCNNKVEEATKLLDLTVTKYPNETWSLMGKALRHAINNEKQEALDSITRKVVKATELDHVAAWWLAEIYALIDERNKAIDYLERATRENINYPLFTKYDPLLENIRGEKRFKKLMEKVKHKWESFEE